MLGLTLTKTHKRRLLFIACCMFGLAVAAALVLFALKQNINLFYTPEELMLAQLQPATRIRVGGFVRDGSLEYLDNLRVRFVVTDFKQDLVVLYDGVLPDLFREGQGVVALGVLDDHAGFKAEQILAKHDENYQPPELANLKIKDDF